MIDKSKGLPADEVFLDLEDAVAPDAKAAARSRVAAALAGPGWAGQLRGVRVNDWTTPWTHADIIEVVSAVGAAPDAKLDVVVLPKVSDVSSWRRSTGSRSERSASTRRSKTPAVC
jgi:citrate lyase subunit beta/citryl-CoA lyase